MYKEDYIQSYIEKNRLLELTTELKELSPSDFYRKVFDSGILRDSEDSMDDGKCCAIIKYRTGLRQYLYKYNKLVDKYQRLIYDYEETLDDYDITEDEKYYIFLQLEWILDLIVHYSCRDNIPSKLKLIKDDIGRLNEKYSLGYQIIESIDNYIVELDKLDREFHKGKYSLPSYNNEITTGTTWSSQVYDDLKNIYMGINNTQANLSPIGFYGNKAISKNASLLFAFNIDVDYVSTQNLQNLIDGIKTGIYPVPTMIVNTGIGVHIWYVLNKPIKLYNSVRSDVSKFKQRLVELLWNESTSESRNKDNQGFMQDSRVVGSQTKLGKDYITRGFEWGTGDRVSIEYLESFISRDEFGNELPKLKLVPYYDLEKINILKAQLIDKLPEYKDEILEMKLTIKMLEAGIDYPEWFKSKILNKNSHTHIVLSEKTYYNYLEEVILNARVGYRYKMAAMLFVLGVKCNIDKDTVAEQLRGILPIFNEGCSEVTLFTEFDIKAASTWYKIDSLTHTRKFMYQFSGIPMRQTNKRNEAYNIEGKTQQQIHLERARAKARAEGKLGGRPKSTTSKYKDRIVEYLKLHDKYNKAQISRDLGINRKTVARWLSEAEEELKNPNKIQIENKDIVQLTPYELILEKYSTPEKLEAERKVYRQAMNLDSQQVSEKIETGIDYTELVSDVVETVNVSSVDDSIGVVPNEVKDIDEKTGIDRIIELADIIREKRNKKSIEAKKLQEQKELELQLEKEELARKSEQIRLAREATIKQIEFEKQEREIRKKEELTIELQGMNGVTDAKGRRWVLYSDKVIYVDCCRYDVSWNVKPDMFVELINRVDNYKDYGLDLGSIIRMETIKLCAGR